MRQSEPAATKIGAQLGYARVSTGRQSLDQQLDALTAAGVDPERVYRDKLSGTSTREQRPGPRRVLPRCSSISAAQRLGGPPPAPRRTAQLVAGQPVECGGEGRDIARVEDHSSTPSTPSLTR